MKKSHEQIVAENIYLTAVKDAYVEDNTHLRNSLRERNKRIEFLIEENTRVQEEYIRELERNDQLLEEVKRLRQLKERPVSTEKKKRGRPKGSKNVIVLRPAGTI